MRNPPPDDLPPARMRYPDAARYLGITERMLRRAVSQGRVAHTKIGLRVEFTTTQLDNFLAASTYTPPESA